MAGLLCGGPGVGARDGAAAPTADERARRRDTRRQLDGTNDGAKVNLPMTTIQEAATYLLNVTGVTLMQLFALGGPALLLIALLSWLSGYVRRFATAVLGPGLYHLFFGWLGTSIHEIAHLLAALMFGLPVIGFRPFTLDPRAAVRGSVTTQPNYGSLYQSLGIFFFGIAPVLFGPLVIYLALYILFHAQMPEIWRMIDRRTMLSEPGVGSIFSSGLAFLGFVFSPRHLLDWRFYLFLYIAFAVGSSVRLSPADVNVAKFGCLPFIVLLFLFNTVLLSLGSAGSTTFAWLTQYYTFLYILLCFVILLDVLAIAILWLPAALRAP
jgi:hypothetical protein